MTETAPYEELGKVGDVEIRKYPVLKVASVRGRFTNEAFWHLFRYITGNNRVKHTIPMTAPVISSEKIAMTTPVISSERIRMTTPVITSEATGAVETEAAGTETMSFVLPSRYATEEPPEPVDPVVRIQEIPEREIAVIRFKGYAHDTTVATETSRLLSVLEKNRIETIGRPFLMQYNSPVVPGFLRRNEVGIEIRWKKTD